MMAAVVAGLAPGGTSWMAWAKPGATTMLRSMSDSGAAGWAAENGRNVTPLMACIAARWDSVPTT